MDKKVEYVPEPEDKSKFTRDFDRFYTAFAGLYGIGIKISPVYRRWLEAALPHIAGPRVLEVSFGTGHLLTKLAPRYETYGLDYNQKFVRLMYEGLARRGSFPMLTRGDVGALPYKDASFDTIVNTMAFSGYPDGARAMAEMARVLKTGGRLVMVDIAYPRDRNRLGMLAAKMWIALGDIIREMAPLFAQNGFEVTEEEIGGFGSVHLYVAEKR